MNRLILTTAVGCVIFEGAGVPSWDCSLIPISTRAFDQLIDAATATKIVAPIARIGPLDQTERQTQRKPQIPRPMAGPFAEACTLPVAPPATLVTGADEIRSATSAAV